MGRGASSCATSRRRSIVPGSLSAVVVLQGPSGARNSDEPALLQRCYTDVANGARRDRLGEGPAQEAEMPAKTEKQRKFMGAELARKRAGKKTKTGMSEGELEKMARKKK